MAKKALRKDLFMEIRKTYTRFLSIFFIVALGVAFFTGIRVSKPDMELSADQYYDESNLMDIRVLGTYGLTEDDLNKIKAIDGVDRAEGSYSYDALAYHGENQGVLKLQALSDQMNKITLSQGRYPETGEECIIDERLITTMGYELGDTIEVFSGNEDPLEDSLNRSTFTITGIGKTPYYLSFDRESSQIGNGSVTGFVMIASDNFALDVFTEINLTVAGAKEMISYRDNYVDQVKEVVDQIKAIKGERCEVRYASIQEEANEKIADGEKDIADADIKLADGEKELADGEKEANEELTDAYKKITDAKKEIADGKIELADGEKQLKEGKEKLVDARKKLNDGKKEYQTGKKDIEKAREDYNTGKEELDAKEKELLAGEAEVTKNETDLSAARAQIDQKKAQLEAGKAYLSEEAYNAALAEITAYETPIIAGEQELAKAKATITEGKKQIAEGKKTLAAADAQITAGEKELATAWKKILDGERDLKKGEKEIADNEKKLADAKQELLDGEQELAENEVKYWDGKAEAEEKIAEAKQKIEDAKVEIADGKIDLADAKEKVADLKKPEWYVLDRDHMQVLAEYGQNAERIGAIGKVFPVIFFLVAALICLTTMTRMVEDERTQIGTLKGLGYGKGDIAAKYLLYAGVASITGGIVGVLVGQKILPGVILKAYGIMYIYLPVAHAPYHLIDGLTAILTVSACTMFATYAAFNKEISETAAQLMRPVAPKKGKRVFLERIPFIWKHLSFTKKASIRNLLRYKKRFFMTVIGIAGCMGLLLVGFGIRDSIHNIAVLQYGELFTYNGTIMVKDGESAGKKQKLYDYLDENSDLEGNIHVYENSVTAIAGDEENSAYLIVPQEIDGFEQYFNLRDRRSQEKYSINMAEDGVIINEKLSTLLGVKVGDTIELKIDDFTKEKVTINAIVENYAMHYVYMTRENYEKTFGKTLETNAVFFRSPYNDKEWEEAFGEEVLTYNAASQIQFNTGTSGNIENMLGSLDIVVWVLIVAAALLAFVVLYNLNNININERKRELATLKVLGFYDGEVAKYVYRENVMLTLAGAITGIGFGAVLHRYVILTAEVNELMFCRNIELLSYILSVILTLAFSFFINWIMYFKLRKIDMIESLKSVE